MLEVDFSYKDRFGQLTVLKHTYCDKVLASRNDIELLLESFILFLESTGFPKEDIELAIRKTFEGIGDI